MAIFHTQYLTDERGQKLSFVLPIKAYQGMLARLEALEDIHRYEEGKAAQTPFLAIDEAFRSSEAQQ